MAQTIIIQETDLTGQGKNYLYDRSTEELDPFLVPFKAIFEDENFVALALLCENTYYGITGRYGIGELQLTSEVTRTR